MPDITANGITIHYEEHGDPAGTPMLLIMGLGAQMTLWPDELIAALVANGYRVIRYDNRDIGLSHKFHGARAPGMARQMLARRLLGLRLKVPYTLSDMAADGAGLLDALGIERAHIVGASMGGMIAQLMAVEHGHRVKSLTSIFSTTGHSKLPPADKPALQALTTRPASMEEEALVEHGIKVARAIGSPDFRPDPALLREKVTALVRRSVYPEGLVRQLAAIVDDGDRTRRLSSVTAPTLVLHGEDDPLVKVECGHATASAIPGARIMTFPGWGHDLPQELIGPIADAIVEHARTGAGV